MDSIREIINDGYQVTLTMKEAIPLNNGFLDREVLDDRKRKVMSFAIDYIKSDFIDVKQSFPKDEIAEVDLSIDMVILHGDEYRRLKRILDRYE